jgi:hypothetical protein
VGGNGDALAAYRNSRLPLVHFMVVSRQWLDYSRLRWPVVWSSLLLALITHPQASSHEVQAAVPWLRFCEPRTVVLVTQ